MKIRIEISSGNMSYVLDKETYMDVNPQAIIEDIETILSEHEVDPDYIGCTVCEHYGVPAIYEPCYSCHTMEDTWNNFTRKTY